MSKENYDKKKYFNLYDYYIVFAKYKKMILYFTLATMLVSTFVYFVIIDPLFLSSTTVKSTAKQSGIAGMLSATGLAALGDVTDIAGGGMGAAELAVYENILLSRRCIEETIIKFDLMNENHEKYMQDAVKNFRENFLELSKDKIAGTLTIGVYNKNPEKAKQIVEFLTERLNKINIELNVQSASNNRQFIEGRLAQIKTDLKNAEDSLKFYQERYGLSPDITVKAALQSEIALESEIKAEEIKLDLLKKMISSDQSEVKLQEEKIKTMASKLNEIRNTSPDEGYLKLKGSPDIVMNFLRLQRNVEIQNKILSYIIPIYEQSKIDEKRDTPVVLVLDYPFVPERKAKPKRIVMILLFTAVGFGLAYTTFFLKDRAKDFFSDKNA